MYCSRLILVITLQFWFVGLNLIQRQTILILIARLKSCWASFKVSTKSNLQIWADFQTPPPMRGTAQAMSAHWIHARSEHQNTCYLDSASLLSPQTPELQTGSLAERACSA